MTGAFLFIYYYYFIKRTFINPINTHKLFSLQASPPIYLKP